MITQTGSMDTGDDNLVALVKQGDIGTLRKLLIQAGLIDLSAKEKQNN